MTQDNSEKTVPAAEVAELDQALADKIIKQVEYYFGDINLSKDKFMQEEIQKDAGWVQLETLIKFNRLKQLSTDFKVIIDSLKRSESNLLEIDDENKKIRRAKPLPDNLSEFETNLKQNTVYVKGFPATISLDELYSFFESHGKVLQIFMRRFPATKQFKGSIFVTFETNEQMKAFLELPEVKYQEEVLNRESQEDYFKRKGPQLDKIKDAKKKKEQDREDKKKQREEAEEAFLKETKIPGAVLHLKGLNSEGTRENLRELFDNFAKVKWVDYNKGEPEAFLRFAEENKAKEALEAALKANNGELVLKEAKLEARVVEGEEEEAYWKDAIKKLMENKKSRGNRHNNNKRKRGRGGNKGYKKNNNDDDDDDPEDGDEENDKKKVKA